MTVVWESPCGCSLVTTANQKDLIEWKLRCDLHRDTDFKEFKRQNIEANLENVIENKEDIRRTLYEIHEIDYGL